MALYKFRIIIIIIIIIIITYLWFLITILSYSLPVSQLQTQQLMASQIRPHIEYLIQANDILLLIFRSK